MSLRSLILKVPALKESAGHRGTTTLAGIYTAAATLHLFKARHAVQAQQASKF